jgi:hypothetical protein
MMMEQYKIINMIIDDESNGQEHVTVELSLEEKQYSITFDKSDLEIMNAWIFENGSSVPANLSDHIIESIREEVKKKI